MAFRQLCIFLIVFCVIGLGWCASTHAADHEFYLVRTDLTVQLVDVVEINNATLVHLDADEGWQNIALTECLAILSAKDIEPLAGKGLVILTDGQRLYGAPGSTSRTDAEQLTWMQTLLGEINVPLERIRSVRMGTKRLPDHQREGDVVVLGNGDLLEGFLIGIGNPVEIEVGTETDNPRIMEVPRSRIDGLSLVTPETTAKGQRVWFADGTVLDMDRVRVDQDSFLRMKNPLSTVGSEVELQLPLSTVRAIRFRAGGVTALASLEPLSIAIPETRYAVVEPRLTQVVAPLDLSPIEMHGPIQVRYPLPEGAHRFAAQAVLPRASQTWGDFELIISADDKEVFRASLNQRTPTVDINVAIDGSELTIELVAQAFGPIQDHLRLERAMIGSANDDTE